MNEMGTRRDLRYHPAEGGVFRELAEHPFRKDPSVLIEDRDSSLVAGSFDAKNWTSEPFALPCSDQRRRGLFFRHGKL